MKQRLLLTLVCVLTSIVSWGYNKGDKFTKDGITYKVSDVENFLLTASAVDASATTDDGTTVVFPYEVHDPLDDNMIYHVTNVAPGENDFPSTVTKVILSEGITDLGSFYTHSQIQEFDLPATLQTLTALNIYKVRKFVIADGNQYFKFVYEDQDRDAEAGYLMSYDGTTIYYHVYPTTESFYSDGVITVPDGVTTVAAHVYGTLYAKCGATTIHLGKDVTDFSESYNSYNSITAYTVDPENAVYHAEDGVLYQVTSDPNVYDLHEYPIGKEDEKFTVWEKCKVLKTLCLQSTRMHIIDLNQVETVENNAFRFNALKTVIFTDAQTEYNNSQLDHCERYVYRDNVNEDGTFKEGYETDRTHSNFHLVDGLLLSTDEKTIISAPQLCHAGEEYTIPAGVTSLKAYSFEYTRIKKFISNAELETIGTLSFYYSGIEEADFSPSGSLGNITGFNGSSHLTNITLSPSVTYLSGFNGCTSLEEVHVPDGSSLTTIGQQAFQNLTSLKKFVFDGSCDNFASVNSRAFSGCTNLCYINLPASTQTIGASAFYNCTSLETVDFAEGESSLTRIATGAFSDSGLKTISIPEGVQKIEKEAFKNCGTLETVIIPSTVTNISPEAFKYCTTLKEIIVSKDNTIYSSVDGYLLSKNKEELKLFPAGKANDKFTLLPPSITKIGDYSFYDCENLKNVTIPNKVTAIGDRAFGLCTSLNTITFLCDAMIDPANIDQRQNHQAFDDGMFANININVRKNLLDTYKAETTFYNKFASITPSFFINNKNEYIAVSDNAVDLLDIQEHDWTYIAPESVVNESGKTMTVALIGDYACQNTPYDATDDRNNIHEIVTFNNVEYVGAQAFIQTNTQQTIQNIIFCQEHPTKQLLSTTRFELTPADLGPTATKVYKEFTDDQKIYVRESALPTCYIDWEDYKSQIGYKIPLPQIKNTYGTFSREFDVDLVEPHTENLTIDQMPIVAFTGKVLDFTDADNKVIGIRMLSINCEKSKSTQDGQSNLGDGTYIPANTGVLLKSMTDTGVSDANAYYRIGEADIDYPSYTAPTTDVLDNVFQTVVINYKKIDYTDAGNTYYNYLISGGAYKDVNHTSGNTMTIHKAYMHVTSPVGVKSFAAPSALKFIWSDDEADATDINAIAAEDASAPQVIYDLTGRRVQNATKGIYIIDGKKVSLK